MHTLHLPLLPSSDPRTWLKGTGMGAWRKRGITSSTKRNVYDEAPDFMCLLCRNILKGLKTSRNNRVFFVLWYLEGLFMQLFAWLHKIQSSIISYNSIERTSSLTGTGQTSSYEHVTTCFRACWHIQSSANINKNSHSSSLSARTD